MVRRELSAECNRIEGDAYCDARALARDAACSTLDACQSNKRTLCFLRNSAPDTSCLVCPQLARSGQA